MTISRKIIRKVIDTENSLFGYYNLSNIQMLKLFSAVNKVKQRTNRRSVFLTSRKNQQYFSAPSKEAI